MLPIFYWFGFNMNVYISAILYVVDGIKIKEIDCKIFIIGCKKSNSIEIKIMTGENNLKLNSNCK